MNLEPKVLIFDLEFFHLNWGADLGFVLCMGWKWLGSSTTHIESIRRHNDGTWMDDGPLVQRCRDIISQADMIVTYNGIKCDVPFLNTRLLLNKMDPLPPIAHKDLLYTVRHKLKMSRNRLLDLQQALGTEDEKTPVRLFQWLKTVIKKDSAALAEIEEHCAQDVKVLEECYLAVRPLLLSHPRLYGYGGCNKCGGTLIKNKEYMTAAKYHKITLKCTKCSGYETRPIAERDKFQNL